mmetsp:Transcript_15480/g.18646  ORF Transcript_15480/g.18646 Transcript_15480/m.18646 type:complete len:327 (-) Transcript_15480:232-1212(-)|eukprot:jgi/Bigna1/61588/fgenesh1_kg.24_\
MINTLLLTAALAFVKADVSETAPIDCVGSWTEWGDCSVPCGCGITKRQFKITTESSNGGKTCDYEDGEMDGKDCKIKDCPIPDISEWSECSVTCGEGIQTRTITYKDSGEDAVEIEEPREQPCFMGTCCAVGNFSEWSECSASCGKGTRTRSRVELTVNGLGCPDLTETEDCQIAECPVENAAQADTVCSKTELSSDLLESETSCMTADTSVCLKTCKGIDECKGFDEKDGRCCFFSESLEEPRYEASSGSSCYILNDEAAPEKEASDFFNLGALSGTVIIGLVVAVGLSGMLSGASESGGISKILATPVASRTPDSKIDQPTPGM